jgi:hypothetical protein
VVKKLTSERLTDYQELTLKILIFKNVNCPLLAKATSATVGVAFAL